ncbi:MAG: alkyl sulfatase dimerization domain-containing protein [Xanthomonadales bacterium]|jgi:alkyl sulfatase BDS1-like metallo-beta-lactamase superfamily hydrolase|nr:alkyl sulfatase dimerization domain-containing protein [Xanthomonadales bacterium]
MTSRRPIYFVLSALLLAACDQPVEFDTSADTQGHSAPTAATAHANQAVYEELDFSDELDFEFARRGLLASDPELRVMAEDGSEVWNMPAYGFVSGEAPASVNPSLWRQSQLNNIHGLFQVAEGVYQLRGYDLSNMTLIEGKTGWIVIDPLTARETAAAALAFAFQHLPARPVSAIIFTHSHIDHFGGVLGIVSPESARESGIAIFAPKDFMEHATSENIIAGPAMSRRAMFMYGKRLARSERGHVGTGLGVSPAFGNFGLLAPTVIIDGTPQKHLIDGIEFVFQHAPDTEAPAEMTFYLPHLKAFHGAEVTSHQMHNVYTLRGARVRDALNWSNSIDESIRLFGEAEIYLASHHWPIWGNTHIVEFLEQQRDLYKYLHDQTVRMFNAGMTPAEIAEHLELPESLRRSFASRGYYGTTRHNARAVYQSYLGWYDGNPANLDPLPPAQAGKHYVKLAGGPDQLLARAQDAFDKAEYRWAATLLNHLVFAEPGHAGGKQLLASVYDQLGYRAESGPWRDVYLSAAFELRHGAPERGIDVALMQDILYRTPPEKFFDSLAVRLNGPEAEGEEIRVKLVFTDLQQSYLLEISNAVLRHRPVDAAEPADATLNITHGLFVRMLTGNAGLRETLFSEELDLEGNPLDLLAFFSLFDKPEGRFNIVTP